MRGKVLVVTHNDAHSIGPVIQELDEARLVLARSDIDLDVLLVDDRSDDATVDLATAEAEQLGLTLQVRKAPEPGPLGALRLGLDEAAGNPAYSFVVTLDGGGQHDARQIPDLVRAHVTSGNGITIGSRWTRGGSAPGTPRARAFGSRLGNQALRWLCRLDAVRDATSGFRVIHPEVCTMQVPAEACADSPTYFASQAVLAQASGFAVAEMPIQFRPRYSHLAGITRADAQRFTRGLLATRRAASEIRSELRSDQTAWAKRQRSFAGQEPAADSHFGALAELEALADAKNFFGWIADGFAGAIGASTVEVGAGLGTVSLALTERYPTTLLALEPASNVYPKLVNRVAGNDRITPRQTTSGALLNDPAEHADGRFDSAVYVNVLEHIEDDTGELDVARRLLAPGGHLCLFVPAMPSLYSAIDHKSGHYRRYTKAALRRKVENAGFAIERIDYFDAASIVPYWLLYRVLGVEDLGGGSNAFYDRVLVPISRLVQRILVHPPIGKNLIVVARRVA